MFMLPNETFAQSQQRAAEYEIKFGAQNAAFRATQTPIVSKVPNLSLFELADNIAKFDSVTVKNGIITNDF